MFQLRRQLLCSASFGGAATGGSLLLAGETDGMGSDFTVSSGAGDVSVKDTSTPGNVVTNVTADSWWGNSGTSPKLVRNSSGTLQWSPHNYAKQSEDITTSWTTSTASVNGSTLTAAAGAGNHYINLGYGTTTLADAVYTTSVDLIAGTAQFAYVTQLATTNHWVACVFDLINGTCTQTATGATSGTLVGTPSLTPLSGGGYRVTFSGSTTTGGGGGVTVGICAVGTGNTFGTSGQLSSSPGALTIQVNRVQFNRGTVATTYLKTTTATVIGLGIDYDGTSYGLLVEPAATNVQRGVDLSISPYTQTKVSVVPSLTSGIAPGIINNEVTNDGTAGGHFVECGNNDFPNGTTDYTFSAYAKLGAGNIVYAQLFITVVGIYAIWNLSTGTLFSSSAGTGVLTSTSITSLGNGWYRLSVTGNSNSGGTCRARFYSANESDMNDSSTGTIYWQLPQIELGTVATSPIPTFAATVTRAADAVSKATTAFPYSSTTETVYCKWTRLTNAAGVANTPFSISKDGNNFLMIYNNPPSWDMYATGSGCDLPRGSALSVGQTAQFTGAAEANNFAASRDGSAVSTDSSGNMMSAATLINLGRYYDGTAQFIRILKIVYVPRRVIDADLPTWRYV